MKKIIGLVLMVVLGLASASMCSAYTCDSGSLRVRSGGSAEVSSPVECAQPLEERSLESSSIKLINIVLGVLGIVAVLVIVVGGLMYTTSGGDMAKVNKAKEVIKYAIIGLVVALLAWAIVNFVLGSIFK